MRADAFWTRALVLGGLGDQTSVSACIVRATATFGLPGRVGHAYIGGYGTRRVMRGKWLRSRAFKRSGVDDVQRLRSQCSHFGLYAFGSCLNRDEVSVAGVIAYLFAERRPQCARGARARRMEMTSLPHGTCQTSV